MRTVLLGEPPAVLAAWLEERKARRQDLYDEVWEGEYHVAPAPHRRHGDLDAQLAVLLHQRARAHGLWPTGPVNIGSADDYRVPDRALFHDRQPGVFLATAALVVEIVSPGDESYAKLTYYFDAGVEEILVVDPNRQRIECYERGSDRFIPAARSRLLDLSIAELDDDVDWPA